MNQVSLAGRCAECSKKNNITTLLLGIYHQEDSGVDYIPVVVNEHTNNYIGNLRNGDLISVVGSLAFNKDSIKVIANIISYIG